MPLAARAPGPAASARRRRRPAAGSATVEPLVVGDVEHHGGDPVAVPLDVDRAGAVQRRRRRPSSATSRIRASSSVRGTALPWSGSAPPGQGSCSSWPNPAARSPRLRAWPRTQSPRPRRSSSAIARGVSPSPQVLSRGKTAASARTTSCPARAAQAAAADPAGPGADDEDVGRCGRRRWRARRPVSQVARCGTAQPNSGNAARRGPELQPVGGGQRLPPGAAAGRGDVVPAGRQRAARAGPRAPAGPRPAAPPPGPGGPAAAPGRGGGRRPRR